MGRRTQQERRDRAHSALLAAAAEQVVESGVRSLTLASVGERAGYSRGIITHHFGSKQALIDALARTTQDGFVPGLEHVPPGLDHLLGLIEGYVGALASLETRERAFLLLWAESAAGSELGTLFREHDERFRAMLRTDVVAAIADGTVRGDVEPDQIAVALVSQLRGLGLQRLLDPENVPVDELRQVVGELWRRMLVA